MTLYPSFIIDCQVSASPLKNQTTMEVTTICGLHGAKIFSRSSRQIFHVNTLITLSSNIITDTYSIPEQNPVQQTVKQISDKSQALLAPNSVTPSISYIIIIIIMNQTTIIRSNSISPAYLWCPSFSTTQSLSKSSDSKCLQILGNSTHRTQALNPKLNNQKNPKKTKTNKSQSLEKRRCLISHHLPQLMVQHQTIWSSRILSSWPSCVKSEAL